MSPATRLPKDWFHAKLGDAVELIRGVSYKKAEASDKPGPDRVPILRATNLGDHLDFEDLVYVPRARVSVEQMLRSGDIVIAASSGSRKVVGKAAPLLAEWAGSFGAFCIGARPRAGMEPKYVAYFMRSDAYRRTVSNLAAGSNINNLKRSHIEGVEFPVCSAGEQRRIVARLDELFSDLDAGVAALDRAKANLARYRAAVLKAAVEGRLTEQWRRENPDVEPASELLKRLLAERRRKWEEEQLAKYEAKGRKPPKGWREQYREPPMPEEAVLHNLPRSWCWTTFGALTEIQLGKMLSRKAYEPSLKQYPYLRNQNVRWFQIDLSDVKEMGFNEHEVEKFRLQVGDLLVCEGGEPGRCAVFRGDETPLMYQKALHRLRSYGGLVSPYWLQFCLAHFASSGTILPRYSETTIQHLPREKLMSSPVVLVPAAEQEVIVALLEAKMSLIDAQVDQVQQVVTRANTLRQTVLRSAFEGELI